MKTPPLTDHNGLTKWDYRFLDIAETISTWSKDPSTKVGAVIANNSTHEILTTGFNGFPRGDLDISREYEDRDTKLSRIIHAEMNCLIHLIGKAFNRKDHYTMYITHSPCDRCATHIAQAALSGVISINRVVVYHNPYGVMEARWAKSIIEGWKSLSRAGIKLLLVNPKTKKLIER